MEEMKGLRFSITGENLRAKYKAQAQGHAARAGLLETAFGRYKNEAPSSPFREAQPIERNVTLEDALNVLWADGDAEKIAAERARSSKVLSDSVEHLKATDFAEDFAARISAARAAEQDATFLGASIEAARTYYLDEDELRHLGLISPEPPGYNKVSYVSHTGIRG